MRRKQEPVEKFPLSICICILAQKFCREVLEQISFVRDLKIQLTTLQASSSHVSKCCGSPGERKCEGETCRKSESVGSPSQIWLSNYSQ